MARWKVKIRVECKGRDNWTRPAMVEFDRDDRDSAYGFGTSELARLIEELDGQDGFPPDAQDKKE